MQRLLRKAQALEVLEQVQVQALKVQEHY
jgi:hypothetical protein